MNIGFGTIQDNKLKVDNLHFPPQMFGVIEPAPVSETPLKKYLLGLNKQPAKDSYVKHSEINHKTIAAANISAETMNFDKKPELSVKTFAITLGTFLVGSALIFRKIFR